MPHDVQDLHAKMSEEALACLSLGLPATVSHIIDEKSPLANLSIQKMASRRMEVRIHSCLNLSVFMHFACAVYLINPEHFTTGSELSERDGVYSTVIMYCRVYHWCRLWRCWMQQIR